MYGFEGKILQLGKFYPIRGGIEKVEYDLMDGLSEKGVHCDMLCAAVKGKGGVLILNSKAKLITNHSWIKLAATMIAPSMIIKLRKICNSYDIIHVHHPDPMAAFALFLSGYKGKVVLHWHSDIIKQSTLLKMYKPLQNWLLRRAECIVGTSPVYLKDSNHLKDVQDKTICLPIGISPVVPEMSKVLEVRNAYKGKKIVFSLGRLVAYKGFKYLIDAVKFLNDNYVVLIGGTGPLKTELEKQIKDNELCERVKLLGRVPNELLASYYGACDVFCLSSIMKTEAFGIVQIEAMSCGKPVVATNIPQSGVSFVNDHGRSGLNVEPANAEKLAEAIVAITKNIKTYETYSLGARNRYRELFTKERMIENCINLYNNL